jgi:hypothetical protein
MSSKQLVTSLQALSSATCLSAGRETDATFAHRMGEALGVRASGEVAQHSTLPIPQSAFKRLSHRLRAFGITPRTLRIGNTRVTGYDLNDFTDAFSKLGHP